MTAASKTTPHRSCRVGFAKRRPVHSTGKAVVLWEETGKCTIRAAGVGGLARRERFVEITSGILPAGVDSKLQRPYVQG